MANCLKANLDKEAESTEACSNDDPDIEDNLVKEANLIKAYSNDDFDMEDVHPQMIANSIAKIDEINIEIDINLKLFIVKSEKAKP